MAYFYSQDGLATQGGLLSSELTTPGLIPHLQKHGIRKRSSGTYLLTYLTLHKYELDNPSLATKPINTIRFSRPYHDIHIGSTPTAGLEPHQLPNPGSFPAAVCTAPNSRGMLRPLEWYPEEHSDGIKPVSESMLRSYLTKRHGCWDKSTTTIDGRVRSDEVDLGMTYR